MYKIRKIQANIKLISFRVQFRLMLNKKNSFLGLIFLALFTTVFTTGLDIQSVQREVLLNGLYPTEKVLIKFISKTDNLNTFNHIVSQAIAPRIKSIGFSRNKQNTLPVTYTQEHYIYNGLKYVSYKVDLGKTYYAEEQGNLYITITYLNRYVNFPAEIALNEDQKFQYEDDKYFLSPYTVKSQFVTYKAGKIINFQKDGELKGITSVVFKKENTEPFTSQIHQVHIVNNNPQVYFTNVERVIEVSHWGNIGITEFYKLKNFGPALKGEFSRVTFGSQEHVNVKNAFKGIEATLPYAAHGLYYRDEVGNISTSRAYRDEYKNEVKFGLVPRFALLGQWKCNWQVGYNLPIKGYLKKGESDSFNLQNLDAQFTLDRVVAQNYDLKIVLPEGASKVQVKIGENVLTASRIEKTEGLLDFFGRPTYVFENYRDSLKNKKVTVNYELNTLSTIYKPIMLFVIFFSLCSVVIIVKRFSFEAFKEDKLE